MRAAEEILLLERFPRARIEMEWNTDKYVSSILIHVEELDWSA